MKSLHSIPFDAPTLSLWEQLNALLPRFLTYRQEYHADNTVNVYINLWASSFGTYGLFLYDSYYGSDDPYWTTEDTSLENIFIRGIRYLEDNF